MSVRLGARAAHEHGDCHEDDDPDDRGRSPGSGRGRAAGVQRSPFQGVGGGGDGVLPRILEIMPDEIRSIAEPLIRMSFFSHSG